MPSFALQSCISSKPTSIPKSHICSEARFLTLSSFKSEATSINTQNFSSNNQLHCFSAAVALRFDSYC